MAAATWTSRRDSVGVGVPSAKRAARVADRIVDDVMALGWPVGHVLGSETELLERYQVSRAVFREAVRLVEHQQVARTRRGPSGGLMITEPTVGAVIDAAVLYLCRMDARLDEVFEARMVLEDLASELAPARLAEVDRLRLRAFVDPKEPFDDPRALHSLVASATGNPALELFVGVLNRVTMLYSPDGESLAAHAAEISHAHSRIAQAVMAGDSPLTRRRMRKHLEAEADYLRSRRATGQLLPERVVLNETSSGKGAESVARNIARAILGQGMRPGELVGTEADLIEREGVSRALLREAVRLLEHHQIARMRRGPGGGLFVVQPSASAVTEVAALYLVRRGMQLSELAELRCGVEVALVQMAASRIDADGVARLRAALEREGSSSEAERAEAVHDLHAGIADIAHNRVLQLVALVLIRLTRLHQIERLADGAREEIRAEVLRTHQGIADAVSAGDGDLAQRRMGRHLDALAAVLR